MIIPVSLLISVSRCSHSLWLDQHTEKQFATVLPDVTKHNFFNPTLTVFETGQKSLILFTNKIASGVLETCLNFAPFWAHAILSACYFERTLFWTHAILSARYFLPILSKWNWNETFFLVFQRLFLLVLWTELANAL